MANCCQSRLCLRLSQISTPKAVVRGRRSSPSSHACDAGLAGVSPPFVCERPESRWLQCVRLQSYSVQCESVRAHKTKIKQHPVGENMHASSSSSSHGTPVAPSTERDLLGSTQMALIARQTLRRHRQLSLPSVPTRPAPTYALLFDGFRDCWHAL